MSDNGSYRTNLTGNPYINDGMTTPKRSTELRLVGWFLGVVFFPPPGAAGVCVALPLVATGVEFLR